MSTDNKLEQARDDSDSQSNREKLYKRFKKLNAQGAGGAKGVSQIQSQKNLVVQGALCQAEQATTFKCNDPRQQQPPGMKIRSS